MRSARVYLLEGDLTEDDIAAIKKYVINPVEAREASLEERSTLKMEFAIPTEVETLTGFTSLDERCPGSLPQREGPGHGPRRHQASARTTSSTEHRDPTITEIRMIDTYWSDHCRHTTFGTILDDVQIDDELVQAAFDRYMALREETRPRQEEPHPDGLRHHRRQGPEAARHPEEPGRERGDQRLHR